MFQSFAAHNALQAPWTASLIAKVIKAQSNLYPLSANPSQLKSYVNYSQTRTYHNAA